MAWTEKYVSNTVAAWANTTAYTTTPLSLVVGSDGYAYFCKLAHTSETGVKGRPTDGTDYGTHWTVCDGSITKPFTFAQMVNDINAGTPAGVRYNQKADASYALAAAVSLSGVGPWIIQGYTTTIGDAKDDPSKRAVITTTDGTLDLLTIASGAVRAMLRDLDISNSGGTGTGDGLTVSGIGSLVERVSVHGFRNNGLETGAYGLRVIECEAYANNANNTANKGGFAHESTGSINYIRCCSHDNAGSNTAGFLCTATTAYLDYTRCISDTNGANGFDLRSRVGCAVLSHCDSYNNGGDGFVSAANTYNPIAYLENCNAVSNTGHGFQTTNATETMILVNCFDYNNAARTSDGGRLIDESAASAYTGDPYVAAATGDFDLDNTASQGRLGRCAARSSFMQTQASYTGTVPTLDVGASNHPITAAANVRYGIDTGNTIGDLAIPYEGATPTGTQNATSDALVKLNAKYGSPERTGSLAAGAGGGRKNIGALRGT